jgi:hypothetical protein
MDAKSLGQKLIALQTRPPRPLRELRPEVPAKLVAVVDKMMEKDAGQRYQSLAEVIADLKPWADAPVAPPAEAEMPRLSLAAMPLKSAEFDLSVGSGPASGGRSSVYQGRSAPPRERDGPPLWLAVALSVVVTAGALIAVWWFFLRPAA